MNRFVTIFFSALATIFISVVIILSSWQVSYRLNLPNPDSIKIYKDGQIAVKTIDSQSEFYNEILNLYNNMTKETMLNQISSEKLMSLTITEKPENSQWNDNFKNAGMYLEFIFNEPKHTIIEVNKNTKRIDLTSIIFRIYNYDDLSTLTIYYRCNDEYSTKINGNSRKPLTLEANTSQLYKYILTII